MTPVETLRAAAALMRERTDLLPEGPWQPGVACVWSGPAADVVLDGNDGSGGTATEEIAAHIASWHPLVALAVADWMDAAASERERFGPFAVHAVQALAVAHAYLGDPS